MGKGGRGSYSSDDIDLFALVALDTRTIGYMAERDCKQTMIFRIPEYGGMYFDERNAARRAEIIKMRSQGLSWRAISTALSLDASQAWRMANAQNSCGIESRYLDSLSFEEALRSYERGDIAQKDMVESEE